MTEPVSERTKQRRRILRAAAGAPIVLTLPSGAALAATSLTCDQKSLNAFSGAVEAFPTTGSADSWMRIQLLGKEIKETNQSDWKLGFVYNGNFYQFSDDFRKKAVLIELPANTRDLKVQNSQVYFYGLVDYPSGDPLIDPSGQVLSGNGNPILGASCWSSLTGVNVTDNVFII